MFREILFETNHLVLFEAIQMYSVTNSHRYSHKVSSSEGDSVPYYNYFDVSIVLGLGSGSFTQLLFCFGKVVDL